MVAVGGVEVEDGPVQAGELEVHGVAPQPDGVEPLPDLLVGPVGQLDPVGHRQRVLLLQSGPVVVEGAEDVGSELEGVPMDALHHPKAGAQLLLAQVFQHATVHAALPRTASMSQTINSTDQCFPPSALSAVFSMRNNAIYPNKPHKNSKINPAYTRNVLRHFLFKPFWAGKPYKFGVQTINRKTAGKSGINGFPIIMRETLAHIYA